jgi:16S rRNA (cytidine1402-2'-O)-methyltransferase
MKNDIPKGRLFLIPTTLGESSYDSVFPPDNKRIVGSIKVFITENIRTTRRFLKKMDAGINIESLTFHVLDQHTRAEDTGDYLNHALDGHDTGLISEAGTPCIADPGAEIVRRAHESGIRVIPLSGPNSIMLALMASVFNGQNFQFHGYLPIASRDRARKIKELERLAWQANQTQIFIETPYRNMSVLEALLKNCQESTALCIACDLTLESESISTKTIGQWRKEHPGLHKRPAVFLLYRS